ncbi:hypothetical protein DL240_09615 [Lujinxingia litoralis]|uniref:Uncharacterized protein n=1 Tax=Lujinxingia litoralis TaxID=2211119 RepID=A0A328C6I7_9DELT|nr:hypothetical protein [Lujinxingia litoralis]RAL23129.1 hypothetical protein DL240_09615 [Lujinxingia litoralis]
MIAMTLFAPRHRLLALLLTTSLLFAPTAAFAQDDAHERATAFYQEASEAYSQGRFGRAVDLLEQAFAHDPNLIYRYNQILAYQGMGKLDEALRMLDIYAETMAQDGRFEDLPELRGQLEAAIAERDAAPEATPAPAPAPLAAPPEAAEPASNVMAWSLVGAGGVALAASALFGSGLLIDDTLERLEVSRTEGTAHPVYAGAQSRNDDVSQLRTHQTLTVAFLAGGVALGAAGATMLFLNPRASEPDAGALHIAPMFTGRSAGAILGGRF